jgi:hypothetical protein
MFSFIKFKKKDDRFELYKIIYVMFKWVELIIFGASISINHMKIFDEAYQLSISS